MIQSYNGFTQQERQRGGSIQTLLFRQGRMARPTRCRACDSGGNIVPHLEDYRTPEEFIALCRRCHYQIHTRFRRMESFWRYVQQVERDTMTCGRSVLRWIGLGLMDPRRKGGFMRAGRKWR